MYKTVYRRNTELLNETVNKINFYGQKSEDNF